MDTRRKLLVTAGVLVLLGSEGQMLLTSPSITSVSPSTSGSQTPTSSPSTTSVIPSTSNGQTLISSPSTTSVIPSTSNGQTPTSSPSTTSVITSTSNGQTLTESQSATSVIPTSSSGGKQPDSQSKSSTTDASKITGGGSHQDSKTSTPPSDSGKSSESGSTTQGSTTQGQDECFKFTCTNDKQCPKESDYDKVAADALVKTCARDEGFCMITEVVKDGNTTIEATCTKEACDDELSSSEANGQTTKKCCKKSHCNKQSLLHSKSPRLRGVIPLVIVALAVVRSTVV